MKIDILTLFPECFPPVLDQSILGRAQAKGLLEFTYRNIRDYSRDKRHRVDDYPYGGGPGMVMQPQPIFDAYQDILASAQQKPCVICMSPRGKVFDQEMAKKLAQMPHLVLLCGHYEGIDQRVIDEICDLELSIGDFVLTGGELGAMVVCDAVARLVPGVLAGEDSYTMESHYSGMLEYPQYTRPEVFCGAPVPRVLLGGNHRDISQWRLEQALAVTRRVRPDLYEKLKDKRAVWQPPELPPLQAYLMAGNSREEQIHAQELMAQCQKLGVELQPVSQAPREGVLVTLQAGNTQPEPEFSGPVLQLTAKAQAWNLSSSLPLKKGEMPELVFATPRENAAQVAEFVYLERVVLAAAGLPQQQQEGFYASCFGQAQRSRFCGEVPYDLFENNRSKFDGLEAHDLMFLSGCGLSAGNITLLALKEERAYVAQGRLAWVKCKGKGRMAVAAVPGLGRFVRHVLLEKQFGQQVWLVQGHHGKQIYDLWKRIGRKEIYFPLTREELYPSENPFSTQIGGF